MVLEPLLMEARGGCDWVAVPRANHKMFTLISADDCASSRAECIKLLESFGASVILEDADGWGVLKCRVEEIRGGSFSAREATLG